MVLSRTLVLMAVGWALATAHVAAAPFAAMIVFGDSLSDTGNIPAPLPYFEGRWSNGPVYVEHLADRLGLPAPRPSSLGGDNFARFDATTSDVADQVAEYLAIHVPKADELFVLYAGSNDFFDGQLNPLLPADVVAGQIGRLAAAGGRHFLVPNLPPLGQVPGARRTVFGPLLDDLAMRFNGSLEDQLTALETDMDVAIHRLDVHAFTEQALSDPAAFGLTNVTDPAFNVTTGEVVTNPDEYLFWDDGHPTAVAHRVLGQRAAAAVPELGGLALLVGGVIVSIAFRRRRRIDGAATDTREH